MTETAPPSPSGPAAAITTGGTYLVGTDIQPGVYRNPEGCHWARLFGVSGELSDIIANDPSRDGPSRRGDRRVRLRVSDELRRLDARELRGMGWPPLVPTAARLFREHRPRPGRDPERARFQGRA
ncbi:MAG: hypothetical protein ACRD0K_03390 [Egibacteraceae bacterium]